MTRHPCYAQAIRWDAWATPIWAYPSHKRIKPHKDKNRVTGVIGAGANAQVLRGKEPTTVELAMIPVKYANSMPSGPEDGIPRMGFRLQFSSSDLGNAYTFGTKVRDEPNRTEPT